MIILSEVWNTYAGVENLLDENGYSVKFALREPIARARGGPERYGGVAVAWKKDRFIFEPQPFRLAAGARSLDLLAGKLTSKYSDALPITVAAIYWAPNSNEKQEAIDLVKAELARFARTQMPHIVAGDFNACSTRWDPMVRDTTSRLCRRGAAICQLVDSIDVFELAAPTEDTFTRVSTDAAAVQRVEAGIIDFALYDPTMFGQVIDSTCSPSPSDHMFVTQRFVLADCPIPLAGRPENVDGPDQHRSLPVNWDKVTDEQRATACEILTDGLAHMLTNEKRLLASSADLLYRHFEGVLYRAMDVLPRVRRSAKRSVFPREIQQLHEDVLGAWRRVVAFNRQGNRVAADDPIIQARAATKLFKQKCKDYANIHFTRDPAKSQQDATEAWKVLERYLRSSVADAPIKNPTGGEPFCTNAAKADALLDLYVKKFEFTADQREAHRLQQKRYADGEDQRPVYMSLDRLSAVALPTFAETRSAIFAHDTSKSPDQNAFDAKLLRMLPDTAIEFLRYVFGAAIAGGKLPSQWRDSVVVPLLKPGKPADELKSHRPVAITNLVCRTYERVVYRRICERIDLAPEQFGFKAGSSTLHPLVMMSTFLNDAFLNDQAIKTEWTGDTTSLKQFRILELGLDFSDAFCRILPDHVVAQYLKVRQKSGPITVEDVAYARVLFDFMQKRRMAVRVGSHVTGFKKTDIGAPQGTILGPLLWSLACEHIIDRIRERLPEAAKEFRIGFWSDPTKNERKPDARSTARAGARPARDAFAMFFYYADDSAILAAGSNIEALTATIRDVAKVVAKAAEELGLAVSAKSTASLYINGLYPEGEAEIVEETPIHVTEGVDLPISTDIHKILGMTFDVEANYGPLVTQRMDLARKYINVIKKLRGVLSPATIRALYIGKAVSVLLYGVEAWGPRLSATAWKELEIVHREGARLITGCIASTKGESVLAEAGLYPLQVTAKCRAHEFVQTLLRRPDNCPVKQQFLNTPYMAKKYKSEADLATLRKWCAAPRAARVDREPIPAYEEPLYSVSETQSATNVRFDLDRGLTGKKSDHETGELLKANLEMYDNVKIDAERLEVLTDGSRDEQGTRTGAAAVLYHVTTTSRTRISMAQMACGAEACAFTTEAHALDMGLRLVGDAVATLPPGIPVHFITDSLSNALRLQRGPCDQKEWMAAQAWSKILRIAQHSVVTIHFAYSHCDWKLQDEIDDLAKSALLCHNAPPPVWHRDEASKYTTPLRRDYATKTLAAEKDTFRFRHCNTIVSSPLYLPWNTAKIIYRLRCGVEPSIGGWKQMITDSCLHCGTKIARGIRQVQTGADHFLCCNDKTMTDSRLAIFGTRLLDPKTLFDDKSVNRVLKYWRLFTNNTDPDLDAREELPPPDAPDAAAAAQLVLPAEPVVPQDDAVLADSFSSFSSDSTATAIAEPLLL